MGTLGVSRHQLRGGGCPGRVPGGWGRDGPVPPGGLSPCVTVFWGIWGQLGTSLCPPVLGAAAPCALGAPFAAASVIFLFLIFFPFPFEPCRFPCHPQQDCAGSLFPCPGLLLAMFAGAGKGLRQHGAAVGLRCAHIPAHISSRHLGFSSSTSGMLSPARVLCSWLLSTFPGEPARGEAPWGARGAAVSSPRPRCCRDPSVPGSSASSCPVSPLSTRFNPNFLSKQGLPKVPQQGGWAGAHIRPF